MPGSTPATSQLDWLSSTTAIIVLSWSKATRDLLKSFSGGIRGTPSVICQRRWCHLLRRLPHTISPLEGAVYCELVSEVRKLGADSGRVMDDSGIVKRCFPHEFGRKLYPPPRGVTPPSGYKSL